MQDGISFRIDKSFGSLQLHPQKDGLLFSYQPVVEGETSPDSAGAVDLIIPLVAIGGIWATARAFLYGVESLDENIILKSGNGTEDSDILIKLYRDKPRGVNGRLSGEEVCWLRIVTGRSEDQRRRIKLGPRDLLCIELACNAVLNLSTAYAVSNMQNGHPIAGMKSGANLAN